MVRWVFFADADELDISNSLDNCLGGGFEMSDGHIIA